MKKLVAIFLLTLGVNAFARSLSIDPSQSGSLAISSDSSNPTQIFSNDPAAVRSYIVNTSTNVLYIVGFSTSSNKSVTQSATFSISTTTGSFFIPATAANVQPTLFSLDGPNDSFTGPVWAVAPSGGMNIERIRMH